ncbi:MAG: hypothetical protein A2857_05935 [Candidatus Levybacteria bacterium RIFCSPHIGHO2_01_FULL_36_15]|nr:MAG: hypothetical protein A2857_05935 [Candidatus Levybacteria bacterium RIFCSPHIGHO2_01_FULL_36_15]OGH38433.1 MAG: hypothetical protein A2905_00735 [Candidatus Levybacteria bacterium RIFCSPLOWO2_01_FULL_36_10]
MSSKANKTVGYLLSLIKSSDKLNAREKDILTGRIKGETLKKIGKRYEVTAERIRQKEEEAILKLKKNIYQLILFSKLDNKINK